MCICEEMIPRSTYWPSTSSKRSGVLIESWRNSYVNSANILCTKSTYEIRIVRKLWQICWFSCDSCPRGGRGGCCCCCISIQWSIELRSSHLTSCIDSTTCRDISRDRETLEESCILIIDKPSYIEIIVLISRYEWRWERGRKEDKKEEYWRSAREGEGLQKIFHNSNGVRKVMLAFFLSGMPN